jgi:formate dehydrogenase subunit beta
MKTGVESTMLDFLRRMLQKKCVDALLIPLKTPGTQAYAWVLVKDEALLESARPLPPVMTVQGGHALSTVSKHGTADMKIAAVLRPCEIRAAVELFKLKQIDLDHTVLIGFDCPGAVPLTEFMTSPETMEKRFEEICGEWKDDEALRPVCRICHRFSLDAPPGDFSETEEFDDETASSDLFIGLAGGAKDTIHLIPRTQKGRALLEQMETPPSESLDEWRSEIREITQRRLKKREEFNRDLQSGLAGWEKLTAAFDQCLNCHNCMRVCPICYCQQCYYDSRFLRMNPKEYTTRAEKRGALRFPLDTLQFHLGRMSHMVLSCVSCGACEDACPMNIPVSQIFSMVGDRTQREFGYTPGLNKNDPPPLQSFHKEEFCEVETPNECGEEFTGEAEDHV